MLTWPSGSASRPPGRKAETRPGQLYRFDASRPGELELRDPGGQLVQSGGARRVSWPSRLEGGYLYANDKPGLGIDVDEVKAAKLLNPERARVPRYVAEDRRADGTVVRP